MKNLSIFLLSALSLALFGCEAYQPDPSNANRPRSIHWKSDLPRGFAGGTSGVGGSIAVEINGTRYLISNDPIGYYNEISATDYRELKIPPMAVSAAAAWWGGHGETLFLLPIETGVVDVYSARYSEVDHSRPTYEKIKQIRY